METSPFVVCHFFNIAKDVDYLPLHKQNKRENSDLFLLPHNL